MLAGRLTRVSIHAPMKVRLAGVAEIGKETVSIHAPMKVRPRAGINKHQTHGFNSRTYEGATAVAELF